MNVKQLKQHIIEDIINTKDYAKLDLTLPAYEEGDSHERKVAITNDIMHSPTLAAAFISEVKSKLLPIYERSSYGLLTRSYINATLVCLNRWITTANQPVKDMTVEAHQEHAASLPASKHPTRPTATISKADAESLISHLNVYGNTVLRGHHYLRHYTLDAIEQAVQDLYPDKKIEVSLMMDSFQPLDLPDFHELVVLGVYKLRTPVLPAILVRVCEE